MLPSLRNTGFYVGGFDPVTNYGLIPLMMVGLRVLPWVSYATWGRLLCWCSRTFNRPPYGTCLHLDAQGTTAGEQVSLHLDLEHSDEYELTAIPMVATIEQMLDGTAHRPGLHYMAHLPEPDRLLRDLAAMGIQIAEKTARSHRW